MGEAKKSNFVEISPSGLPKVKGKKKIEKGGTGRKNGWGEKNGPHWPMKKNGIFFQIFFSFRKLHSPYIFGSWGVESSCI